MRLTTRGKCVAAFLAGALTVLLWQHFEHMEQVCYERGGTFADCSI